MALSQRALVRIITTSIALLIFGSKLLGTEFLPWLPPPLEFQGRIGYVYDHETRVQSPRGSFNFPGSYSSLHSSLGVCPWPYCYIEAELFLTHTHQTHFSYEAALCTFRYNWLDDITGDPFCLTTGITLSFPGNRFLHHFSFPYHDTTNLEGHLAIGKEWSKQRQWIARVWGLAGVGCAEKGSPWLHGRLVCEWHPYSCFVVGAFSEAIYGLGSRNIIPNVPFGGYAPICHQMINLGSYLDFKLGLLGTLRTLGWYNVHAHNWVEHGYGGSLSLLIPFSLL